MAEQATVDSLNIQISASSASAVTALSSLSASLDKTCAKMEELTSVLGKNTRVSVYTAKETQKVSKEVRSLSNSASKAAGGLGKLASSFKRILFYRTIRTIIKNIGAAIREGLTNLKEYSAAVGTAFSPAVDNLRQHVLLLKNAFATALRPIIEAIIPVIIRLCNWLAKAADFLAQVFSVITGKVDANGRYTKAVLGDLKQSNKEAKALRRTLLGFDEINRLDGESPKSESTTTPGTMFTQADVSEKAKKWAERLQKVLDIIKKIVKAVTDFIKRNPWILKLAAIILGAVAAFKLFKKILSPVVELFDKLGWGVLAIAAVIVAFALFGNKIKELCDKAKKKVDEFFDNLKEKYPELAGIIEFVQGIVDFVLDTFGLVADAVYKFVHGDAEGALDDLKKIFENVLENPEIALAVAGLVALAGPIIKAFSPIAKFLGKVIAKVFPALLKGLGKVVKFIAQLVGSLGPLGVILLVIIAIFAAMGDKIKEFCDNAKKKIDEFFRPFREASPILNGIFGIVQALLDFILGTIGNIAGAVYALFHGDFKKAGEYGLEFLKGIVNFIIDIVVGVINFIGGIVAELVNGIAIAGVWILNKLIDGLNWLLTALQNIQIFFHNLLVDIKIMLLKVLKWILDRVNDALQGILRGINVAIETMNKVFGTDIDPIVFEVDSSFLDDKIEELENTKLDPIKETVEFVGKVQQPEKFQLNVDSSDLKNALWGAEQQVDRIISKITVVSGRVKKELDLPGEGVPKYASGGFPSMGSLFIAGESGASPELVGNFGGGTQVMNSEQLSQALYAAMSAALANNPQGGGDIYLDGEVIYRNTVRRNNNRVRATGRSALLT